MRAVPAEHVRPSRSQASVSCVVAMPVNDATTADNPLGGLQFRHALARASSSCHRSRPLSMCAHTLHHRLHLLCRQVCTCHGRTCQSRPGHVAEIGHRDAIERRGAKVAAACFERLEALGEEDRSHMETFRRGSAGRRVDLCLGGADGHVSVPPSYARGPSSAAAPVVSHRTNHTCSSCTRVDLGVLSPVLRPIESHWPPFSYEPYRFLSSSLT